MQTWTWDGTTWHLLHPATAPSARASTTLAYDEAHREMVLFGGRQDVTPSLNDTWTWDGRDWTERHPTVSPPNATGAAVFDPRAGSLVAVLSTTFDTVHLQTWAWDGTSWHQRSPTISPPYREQFSAARPASGGGVALFGGKPGGNPLGDFWLWDGANWGQR
jgi:hypothetical protein